MGALQTRDLGWRRDTGSAVHRFTLHRIRETAALVHPTFTAPSVRRRCSLVSGGSLRPEFDGSSNPDQNEDRQHRGLRDREWRLRLRWRERVQRRHLDEALHDQDEDIQIERRYRGDDINPAPRALEAFA